MAGGVLLAAADQVAGVLQLGKAASDGVTAVWACLRQSASAGGPAFRFGEQVDQ